MEDLSGIQYLMILERLAYMCSPLLCDSSAHFYLKFIPKLGQSQSRIY